MLVRLDLRNIVLIARAELEFGAGLTVLSGETGAGKSILLGALGLILGKRADSKMVRAGMDAANVTATFTMQGNDAVTALLQDYGIDAEDMLIIRRQIKADGTSRAYINDQPVTVKLLKTLGSTLIDIHGQHDQKGLMDASHHHRFLDSYAGNATLLSNVAEAYKTWRSIAQEITKQEKALEQAARERDYTQHILQELDALNPQMGEEEQLVEQRAALMQAEKSGALLREVSAQLCGGMHPVAEIVRQAQQSLLRAPGSDGAAIQQIIDALERTQDALGEAEIGLDGLIRDDNYDEAALEAAQERLFDLREAARKHRTTADGLVDILTRARTMIATLESGEDRLGGLYKQRDNAAQHYTHIAVALHDARVEASSTLEQAIHAELAPLKMEATRFRVICEPVQQAHWSAHGADAVHFEVSTNPGSPFGPLHAIASGGELSRFMLALAVVLGAQAHPPMLIFDEIDTGTGGAVADAIGARLKQLSRTAQCCVVTHSPQVAAQGDTHYHIAKSVRDGQTHTHVTLLEEDQRQEELARMLSGAQVTDEARRAAAKLLDAA